MIALRFYAVGALFAAFGVCVGACSTGTEARAAPAASTTLSNVPVETTTSALRLRNLSLAQLRARFQQDVETDPKDKFGWYNLGVIAEDVNDSAMAVIDYQHAIALDPMFASALYNLGILRYQAHDYPAAVAFLTRAVAANPNDADARTNLNDARFALRAANSTGNRPPACPASDVQADAFVLSPTTSPAITNVEVRITNLSSVACSVSAAPALEAIDNVGTVIPIGYLPDPISTPIMLTLAPGTFASARLNSTAGCFRASHSSRALASVSISLASGRNITAADPIQLVPCAQPIVASSFSVHPDSTARSGRPHSS